MAIETDAERLVFFADFGQTITKADTTTFTAIFDDEFAEAGGLMNQIETSSPQLTCRTSDVSGLAHNAVLTFGGSTYHVIGIEPEGTGITILKLEKQ